MPPSPSKPLPYSKLTLDDWRSSPERVAYAAELLRTPRFLDLVGMLANIRPPECRTLDAITTAVLLGERTGHDQVISTILAAGTPQRAMPGTIEADYAPENTMAAWEQEGNA